MENETADNVKEDSCRSRGHMMKHMCCHGSGGALYGLGFLGALVYYLTTATSLWTGFLGIIKAILWPAFLVFGAMKYLGM
jgi:hypothetical protein